MILTRGNRQSDFVSRRVAELREQVDEGAEGDYEKVGQLTFKAIREARKAGIDAAEYTYAHVIHTPGPTAARLSRRFFNSDHDRHYEFVEEAAGFVEVEPVRP